MLPNECRKQREINCPECGVKLQLKIVHTCAYYIGFYCNECGPISRESGYYKTCEEAEADLNKPMEVWKEHE